jgi:nicotinamidase-related amidase
LAIPSSIAAVLVVDMVNDFVTGVFGHDRAQAMVPRLAALLGRARQAQVPVIYCNDSHLAGIDVELRIHPDHAIRGTWGAELTPELANSAADYVVAKRRYSAFFATDLEALLTELGVKTVVLTGVATDGCVQHTAADAFFRGYELIVVRDCVETRDGRAQQASLLAMQRMYGARIVSSLGLGMEEFLQVRVGGATSYG